MKKVITYGTYDILHYGHIRLLERAKALGDYLIVGVTADDFDKTRGKINVQQSLMERVEAVRQTGIADEIIIEEYEGQKIDDIKRYDVDIFTVGSDWKGKFDYLNEYCEVVYLDRTQGISSSEIRTEKREIKIGLAGKGNILQKYYSECKFVNGVVVSGICSEDENCTKLGNDNNIRVYKHFNEMLNDIDAIYIVDSPRKQYGLVKEALLAGKHVICEAPVALSKEKMNELFTIAEANNLILMEALKTAYSTAFNRLQLLIKSGKIGDIVSIDSTCTSIKNIEEFSEEELAEKWNSMFAWGPTALLPIFQLLGVDYKECNIKSLFVDENKKYDAFSRIDLLYEGAVATAKVGQGVKSEGELVISGTKGYAYVPAPWWKTDYFEIRYEDQTSNKRYFYQLEGEGIRYELVAFIKAIASGKETTYVDKSIAIEIAKVMEKFEAHDIIVLGNH